MSMRHLAVDLEYKFTYESFKCYKNNSDSQVIEKPKGFNSKQNIENFDKYLAISKLKF